jgi:acetyl-CoA/propionyl-CoA carboxylase biotin carboxyl carrier protein
MDTGLIETLLPLTDEAPTASMLSAARGEALRRASARDDTASPQRSGAVWRELTREDAREVAFLTDADDEVRASTATAPASRARAATDDDGAVWVSEAGRTVRLRPLDRRGLMQRRLDARSRGTARTSPEGLAPMPGSVVAVHVEDGQIVEAGMPLVSIEAMKMEHQVRAPHDGAVHLLVAVGDQVRRDQPVARVTTEESA